MVRFRSWFVLMVLAACSAAYAQFPQALKVMNAVVIPNSNIVFSVSNKAPKTAAEWAAVQKSAENLVLGARQIMPLGPDTGREAWVNFTDALGAAARKAADAAKARNVNGVVDAGDAMYENCEGCHRVYMKK